MSSVRIEVWIEKYQKHLMSEPFARVHSPAQGNAFESGSKKPEEHTRRTIAEQHVTDGETGMLELRESSEMTFSDVQCRLRELGYYEDLLGEGPRRATLAALERFQREHGLQVTRRADPITASALRGSASL
jgi:hypothetical protein